MKIVLFYDSLLSDFSNGNAHFLRGIVTELSERGHKVKVYEPEKEIRFDSKEELRKHYPLVDSSFYNLESLDLDKFLQGADIVIVHGSNDDFLIKKIGEHRKDNRYKLLFQTACKVCVADTAALKQYDGILALSGSINEKYLSEGWNKSVWTWHEGADANKFYSKRNSKQEGDLVWIANWAGEDCLEELQEYLFTPVKFLNIKAKVYGLGYPEHVLNAFSKNGVEYGGGLPNYKVPEIYSRFKIAIHIPKRSYLSSLAGVPTIRPFEALSCGIPLISLPWEDKEKLFSPGKDYLVARSGEEMNEYIRELLSDEKRRQHLIMQGLKTINAKHTCYHRVNELERIFSELGLPKDKIYPEEDSVKILNYSYGYKRPKSA